MNTTANSLFWKLLERFGVLGFQFILQVILARLMTPKEYGVLAFMIIFTAISNVFIQTGFSTALIQDKEVTEEDYSSVFWTTFGVAVFIYLLLFCSIPYITSCYGIPEMIAPFRVLCLVLLPGSLNSVQLAKVSREMDFKHVFTSNLIAIIISGLLSIWMAYNAFGIWALVTQTVLNTLVATIVMFASDGWYPRLSLNFYRIKILFSFGWKLTLSALLDVVSRDVSSIVIGKFYSVSSLGEFTRGQQFPRAGISAIVGAIQSVMLPSLSRMQEDKTNAKNLLRRSMQLSSYMVFPIMAGLAGAAKPLVSLLLTERWLGCVPYIQVFCFSYAFWPVHVCNLQAINAMGRSDWFLRLEVIKKFLEFISLIIVLYTFDTPIAIAAISIVLTPVGCFLNAYPNKHLLKYSYLDQWKDIFPSLLLSIVMFCILVFIEGMFTNPIITLLFQFCIGTVIYVVMSKVLDIKAFNIIIEYIKSYKLSRKTSIIKK